MRSQSMSSPALPPDPIADLMVEANLKDRYSVLSRVGLLDEVPTRLRELFSTRRVMVITDQRVSMLYGESLVGRLCDTGIDADSIVVDEGEPSKSLDTYVRVVGRMFELGFDRRAVLVNLGGGVITDLGGFIAATYMRGISYVNVPTTLLAQLDSAIGGKVGINLPSAKNFVGAFYHPKAVWCDPEVLATLPRRHFAAGIAEAIKVALIGSERLFELLERERTAILERCDPAVLTRVIGEASSLKVELLAPDPYEHDLRRLLNLGHTFAHPLEVELGYNGITHGDAVAYGLAVAAAISFNRQACGETDLMRVLRLLAAYHLPPAIPADVLAKASRRFDAIRLVRANQLNYVYFHRIGHCAITPELTDGEIERALALLAELRFPWSDQGISP